MTVILQPPMHDGRRTVNRLSEVFDTGDRERPCVFERLVFLRWNQGFLCEPVSIRFFFRIVTPQG